MIYEQIEIGLCFDTQCGLFATGKVLRRFNVPFTYVTNIRVEDPVFERGFTNFVVAANVVRQFKSLHILQIGPRPASFWTMICNEGELLETIDYIKEKLDYSEVTEDEVRRIAALKVAMKSFARKVRRQLFSTC